MGIKSSEELGQREDGGLPGGQRPAQVVGIVGFKRQNETNRFQIAYDGREGLEWESAATGGERAGDL